MSKCLVTGGAGFIASHVVEALIEDGHDVVVMDNLSTGDRDNIPTDIEFVEKSIEDRVAFEFLQPVDYVFHLAALARIQPSIDNPTESHDVNLTGTLNVLEYARKCGAKVIFSSSSSIYDDDQLPTREDAQLNLKNPYALQKYCCEQYIQLYGRLYDLKYAILRYFNVYGERQILDGAYAAVVGILLDQKAKGKKLTITNDGVQRRDFTYVKDVAQANLMAMGWHSITNIGTGKSYSINDLAEAIGGEKEYIGDRMGEAKATLADIGRARNLGWEPTKDIKDWINDALKR